MTDWIEVGTVLSYSFVVVVVVRVIYIYDTENGGYFKVNYRIPVTTPYFEINCIRKLRNDFSDIAYPCTYFTRQ